MMTMKRVLRRWGPDLGAGVAVALAACLSVGGAVGSAEPVAHAARTISVSENASLHLVRKSGSVLSERGTATGTLPGSVKARFVTSVIKTTGTVTFYPSGGSVTVSVVGYPRSFGTVAKFGGTLRVRRGTGRYAGATGSGTFSGTVNRRTWATTVHAKARLTY